MQSQNIHKLDATKSTQLLERLSDWRSGICPNGKLAPQPCFVLKKKPSIYIHPDCTHSIPLQYKHSTTAQIITEWDWASDLIHHCAAITHLNDDSMLKTIAQFFMIFHASSDSSNKVNTLHLLQLFKHASFKTDHVERPTRALQQKLDKVFAEEADPNIQWLDLLDLWDTFGYLWPRKIVLGYKKHTSITYKSRYMDSLSAYYHHLNVLQEKLLTTSPPPEHNWSVNGIGDFLKDCCIVSRLDLAPLHFFLAPNYKHAIEAIIDRKFVRVPLHHPIKLYNALTDSYLCWDPALYPQANDHYNTRAISAEATVSEKSFVTQYLWRLSASLPSITKIYTKEDDQAKVEDEIQQIGGAQYSKSNIIRPVRGSSQIYIHPACKSPSFFQTMKNSTSPGRRVMEKVDSNDNTNTKWAVRDRLRAEDGFEDTHKMILSCRSYSNNEKSGNQSMVNRDFTKLRGLRLLLPETLPPNYYYNEQLSWTVQYPNSSLRYITNAQTNIRINFNEHIRQMKPVLIGDTIQLQQIGLLTVFDPMTKAENINSINASMRKDNSQLSLRTAKRISDSKSNNRSKRLAHANYNSKKNVFCVDEDITSERFVENTYWKIELATEFDRKRHSSNLYPWPTSALHNTRKTYTDQDQQNSMSYNMEKPVSPNPSHCWSFESESIISTRNSSKSTTLRKTKSLGSIQDKLSSIHIVPNSDKAHYFENLVAEQKGMKSRLLSQFVKRVTLQPLTQLVVKPTKSVNKSSHSLEAHLSPPPFSCQNFDKMHV
ncbi:hypothetical protein BDF20DRAFT_547739 [Mycotypha africana]|uniref:uncharacterized protein n=1 Tax=Mycotypha africana TaxID=64632 RepID=UPI002301501D|nr:uncharacterized protein BDF20DRAFT_547739 [Mycotypha africana]KAI8977147.1 hypothetical protein BDF20DRAFT_547739 [Mycotypha africana]